MIKAYTEVYSATENGSLFFDLTEHQLPEISYFPSASLLHLLKQHKKLSVQRKLLKTRLDALGIIRKAKLVTTSETEAFLYNSEQGSFRVPLHNILLNGNDHSEVKDILKTVYYLPEHFIRQVYAASSSKLAEYDPHDINRLLRKRIIQKARLIHSSSGQAFLYHAKKGFLEAPEQFTFEEERFRGIIETIIEAGSQDPENLISIHNLARLESRPEFLHSHPIRYEGLEAEQPGAHHEYIPFADPAVHREKLRNERIDIIFK